MPKLTPSETELANRKTRAIISYGMSMIDISQKELAKRINRDERTLQRKRQHPETITLSDIRIFVKLFKLSDAQVIEMLGIR